MNIDDTTIHQLMSTINELKKEIERLREQMKDLAKDVRANTFELSKNN